MILTAAVHIPVAAEHVGGPRYLLLGFDALVLVSAALAASLLVRVTRATLLAAVLTSVAAISAYVVSRSYGLPLEDDDIGDWANTLGVVAVLAEASVLVAAAHLLRRPT
ncbi:MAG TPA: hypothetical protein VFL59_10975 [Candidatus Nanopelagicales bacterium]|nr:hypothetical protein [Candidatus Nanopelagicales bacterium]